MRNSFPENLADITGALRNALASWFERAQRPLPWRIERSLYRTVVSEFMLQQTQVATMLPYFERWMRALPDFATLARADEATVLKLWEGLGYYRRARLLHRLARELLARNGEVQPHTAAEWRELPGVGPYTAAAIASISFGEAVACVDGNVVRILARLTGETRPFAGGSAAVKHFTALAGALLDPIRPGLHNEAMMELGATICVRRNPRCGDCPVAAFCAARSNGTANELPRIARATSTQQTIDRAWLVHDGALLLYRIPRDARRLNGMYELPTLAQAGFDESQAPFTACEPLATRRRAITRFQITERIFRAEECAGLCSASAVAESDSNLEWVPLTKLDAITLSGPHRRWIEALLAQTGTRVRSPR